MSESSEIFLRVTRDRKLAEEWELVLLSQGLSPSVRRTRGEIVLSVPENELERARAGLSAYERENPPNREEADVAPGSGSLLAGIAGGGMLLGFFFVTAIWRGPAPWLELGSADAGRIAHGELWRTVTALTLHADLVHAATNAFAAAIFFGALSAAVGPGLGSALILLAGAGGNLINAILQGPSHVSVGASTAIFGAIGMLGSLAMARRLRGSPRGRRAWVPLAATLALLAMLGTAGERVDVWAHLFGFLAGAVLGIPIAFVAPARPGSLVQWACGGGALAVVVYCWALVFR